MRLIVLRITIPSGALTAFGPATAVAQSSIVGVVRDTSGAVLPGVTVEAASPALIEKVRSAASRDARPRHRVRLLSTLAGQPEGHGQFEARSGRFQRVLCDGSHSGAGEPEQHRGRGAAAMRLLRFHPAKDRPA